MLIKLLPFIFGSHKRLQPEPEKATTEPPSYESLSHEHVLGSADPTIYSLGTFDLGVFTPHPSRSADNIELYDSVAPLPIFPVYKNRLLNTPRRHDPRLGDYWPLGFLEADWDQTWHGREHKIDLYLRQARSIYDGSMLPWTHEYEYKGAPYRLTIDHQRSLDGLPVLTHGMVISFLNCNSGNNRYIIDHCVHQDDLNAYLKVVCFSFDQSHFDIGSYRPPLILVAPLKHCKVRPHVNVTPLQPKNLTKGHTNFLHPLQCFFKLGKY